MAGVTGAVVAFEVLGVAKSRHWSGSRGYGRCFGDRDNSCDGLGFDWLRLDWLRLMRTIEVSVQPLPINLKSQGRSICRRWNTNF